MVFIPGLWRFLVWLLSPEDTSDMGMAQPSRHTMAAGGLKALVWTAVGIGLALLLGQLR